MPNTITDEVYTAVETAYSYRTEDDWGRTVLYNDQLHALLTRHEQRRSDPLYLFHYFTLTGADWYIHAASGRGDAVMLYGVCCLGDPSHAEVGPVLLRDLVEVNRIIPVELDRYYEPRRVSEVMASLLRAGQS